VYWRQGRLSKAQPPLERALALWEKASHRSVATGMHNLAELYAARGKRRQAQAMLRRLQDITKTDSVSAF